MCIVKDTKSLMVAAVVHSLNYIPETPHVLKDKKISITIAG